MVRIGIRSVNSSSKLHNIMNDNAMVRLLNSINGIMPLYGVGSNHGQSGRSKGKPATCDRTTPYGKFNIIFDGCHIKLKRNMHIGVFNPPKNSAHLSIAPKLYAHMSQSMLCIRANICSERPIHDRNDS